MRGEESTETEGTKGLASLQDTLGGEQIAFVDTLAEEIETALEETSQHYCYEYMVGEVTNYCVSANDDAHFDLVHEGAQLHCVLLQFRREAIDTALEDGNQVAVTGHLSFYTVDNHCAIMVEDAIAVEEGTYQRTYEENKQLLEADDLLDDTTTQPLPASPRCIGLATRADSDAREDAVASIHSRHPGVEIIVQDTAEGDTAGRSMIQAIGSLNADPRVDVIVLMQAGGSNTHLRVFNETALCRVIHRTQTPIAVSVGHDARTLAETVADQRIMTPTEVGTIVPDYDAVTSQLTRQRDRLDQAYKAHEQQKRHEYEQTVAAQARRRKAIALTSLLLLVLALVGYVMP